MEINDTAHFIAEAYHEEVRRNVLILQAKPEVVEVTQDSNFRGGDL